MKKQKHLLKWLLSGVLVVAVILFLAAMIQEKDPAEETVKNTAATVSHQVQPSGEAAAETTLTAAQTEETAAQTGEATGSTPSTRPM